MALDEIDPFGAIRMGNDVPDDGALKARLRYDATDRDHLDENDAADGTFTQPLRAERKESDETRR